ncbi:hypothetical protein [Pseudomonas petrae]|uniref:Uncharacterized protein n=1 Tax=Pseudomonas petrae TaxID=2912190 RepID=A0ABS9I6U7_9PSED|nr:hypothetical protein [Pseudomonas petrae]MCF7532178.1 hypothetical protein [Pseudomonas petrae]MCF7537711.1 hypothetical protein [Pseudomonas petrae]MCF7543503.1 hypothetical protein [Pseudomonas petrae]
MELVTLAPIDLNRIGLASFSGRKTLSKIMEVADGRTETLKQAVVALVYENGESTARLQLLHMVNARTYGSVPGAIAFDIQDLMTQYSDVYSNCLAYPALKIGERYFKLQEIEVE